MRVIIIGAGLAGLTCAKVLNTNGHEVSVYEASDGVGGRVRTDEADGFLLDRGFQVFFTAYPAAKRHLDYGRLDLRAFDPGAAIHRGRRTDVLSDPLRDPASAVPGLLTDVASFADKLNTLRLSAKLGAKGLPVDSVTQMEIEAEVLAEQYLLEAGFSERILDNFFRPFYGGIFLDRTLATSARVLAFTFSMLTRGETTVPTLGMQRIPEQLASHLPEGSVHLSSRVEELLAKGERVSAVRVNGAEVEADAVVVATESPSAAKLAGKPTPEGAVGEVCVYYELSGRADGKKVGLGAGDGVFFNNASEMTAVSDAYAPTGRKLLSAVHIGQLDGLSDNEIYRRGITELSDWYPDADFRPLAVYRLPFCQFAQPPGTHRRTPGNATDEPGLYLAGEYTEDASINGAMLSGEKAAKAVMA
ncbi:NAD(P)/FAD-dependent oxidoreductase [Rubrobacter indicoceani]|uniref:NAD(P)/FAD-dependent oxidoreductase n=1 Tax=Rubrobacter indicoceani TaxID=2051957 RepID=UPI000E5B4AEA|nr:NAD(P)/FAD-dependent oxidoreductase [Rubrobacter indicoceani]